MLGPISTPSASQLTPLSGEAFTYQTAGSDVYRSRAGRGIGLTLAVYAEEVGGTGGTVGVYSYNGIVRAGGFGTPLISVSGITTLGWYTASAVEHGGTLAFGDWGSLMPYATNSVGGVRVKVYSVSLVIEDT
jgi:hypothetical protein